MRITIKDCIVQTFRAGGKGGQNQNKRDTGVRIIHRLSGAVGVARDERFQFQNKKLAFRRMAESAKFKAWVRSHDEPTEVVTSSAERIRTYNLVDHRVTDHRSKVTSSKVDEILDGNLDLIRNE